MLAPARAGWAAVLSSLVPAAFTFTLPRLGCPRGLLRPGGRAALCLGRAPPPLRCPACLSGPDLARGPWQAERDAYELGRSQGHERGHGHVHVLSGDLGRVADALRVERGAQDGTQGMEEAATAAACTDVEGGLPASREAVPRLRGEPEVLAAEAAAGLAMVGASNATSRHASPLHVPPQLTGTAAAEAAVDSGAGVGSSSGWSAAAAAGVGGAGGATTAAAGQALSATVAVEARPSGRLDEAALLLENEELRWRAQALEEALSSSQALSCSQPDPQALGEAPPGQMEATRQDEAVVAQGEVGGKGGPDGAPHESAEAEANAAERELLTIERMRHASAGSESVRREVEGGSRAEVMPTGGASTGAASGSLPSSPPLSEAVSGRASPSRPPSSLRKESPTRSVPLPPRSEPLKRSHARTDDKPSPLPLAKGTERSPVLRAHVTAVKPPPSAGAVRGARAVSPAPSAASGSAAPPRAARIVSTVGRALRHHKVRAPTGLSTALPAPSPPTRLQLSELPHRLPLALYPSTDPSRPSLPPLPAHLLLLHRCLTSPFSLPASSQDQGAR